jgi:hypothetical protein
MKKLDGGTGCRHLVCMQATVSHRLYWRAMAHVRDGDADPATLATALGIAPAEAAALADLLRRELGLGAVRPEVRVDAAAPTA